MSLDLPHLIESAADEVAHAGRAAAGSINDLVHDWSHETRSFVSEHAPSLPIGSHRRGHSTSPLRLLVPVLVLGALVMVLMRRRRRGVKPHLPEREPQQHDSTTPSKLHDVRPAQGAAAS
jgi:hypothetical protein